MPVRPPATSLVITLFIFSLNWPALAQLDHSLPGAARRYVEKIPARTEQFALPSNLHVTSAYRELVEPMATESPTFRRQLIRIAAEPRLTVHVEVLPEMRIPGARAATRLVRRDGMLTARIEVSQRDDVVELIAHEIEHVIEQIDGVDLATYAGLPGTGVHTVGADGIAFETVRASRTGENVAREVRASRRRGL